MHWPFLKMSSLSVYPYSFKQFLLLLVTYNASAYTVSGHVHRQGEHFWIHPLLNLWLSKLLFQCHLFLYVIPPNSCCLLRLENNCLCELVCAFLINKLQGCRGKAFFCCGPLWYSSSTRVKNLWLGDNSWKWCVMLFQSIPLRQNVGFNC